MVVSLLLSDYYKSWRVDICSLQPDDCLILTILGVNDSTVAIVISTYEDLEVATVSPILIGIPSLSVIVVALKWFGSDRYVSEFQI